MQLRQRITTAVVLLSVFLVLVFLFPTPWFALGSSLVILAGAMEWAALLKLGGRAWRFWWLFAFGAVLWLTWLHREEWVPFVIPIGLLWWIVAVWRLWYPASSPEPVWFRAVAAVTALVPAWLALVYLHMVDLTLFIALFLIVWLADTGAYFVGRALGKRKLAPAISPGKTIEGAVGGIVSVAVFATIGAAWAGIHPGCGVAWIAVCLATALVSVVGDLWESKMKRIAGVKDSGSLLPGHGGVLDRIDSVVAAAPVFVAGLYLAGGDSSCGFFSNQM